MKLKYSISILILFPLNILFAQLDSTSIITEDLLDNILDESDKEEDNSEFVDIIEELIRDPIDLNSADIIELTKIPYINQQSAKLILDYRSKFGLFYSTNELYSVKGLGNKLVQSILPFLKITQATNNVQTVEKTTKNSFFNSSRFVFRSRIMNDLQTRNGFLRDKFLGSKLKSYNRFLYDYRNKYQLGFLTDKDPGETSYTDFISFYLQVKEFGILKNIVGGDYTLEYGQGLALWSPFGFSKGADAIFPVKKRSTFLRPYKSSTEYRFFRGGAATVDLDNIIITAFYSINTLDATLDPISGEITSIGQTGFHRFDTELNKRAAAQSKVIGGVLDYRWLNNFNLGVIYYNANFDKSFAKESIYDLDGNNFNYISTYYDLNFSKINFFGEFSFDSKSVASINGLQILAAHNFIFTSSVRSYPRNYRNLYGFGFSERNGEINNELGLYSGVKWELPYGNLNFYYDIFKFPYRTSENSLSSEGNEILADFISKPFTNIETRFRYKYENKEVTELIDLNVNIVRRLKQFFRAEFVYNLDKNIRLKSRFEYDHFLIKDANLKEEGYLMFEDIRYIPVKRLNLYGRIIFFQTDSFNSAIYEFENDLLGVMPNLAMYGKGVRMYLIIKYELLRFLSLSAKYSETYKPQETSLSSGDNLIYGNVDNRFSLQIDLRL